MSPVHTTTSANPAANASSSKGKNQKILASSASKAPESTGAPQRTAASHSRPAKKARSSTTWARPNRALVSKKSSRRSTASAALDSSWPLYCLLLRPVALDTTSGATGAASLAPFVWATRATHLIAIVRWSSGLLLRSQGSWLLLQLYLCSLAACTG